MAKLDPLLLASLALVGVGGLFHIIGGVSSSWLVIEHDAPGFHEEINRGLFTYSHERETSNSESTQSGTYEDKDLSDNLKSAQSMYYLGVICAICGSAPIIFMILLVQQGKPPIKILPFIAIGVEGFSSLFMTICLILFKKHFEEVAEKTKSTEDPDIGWAMILVILGLLLTAAGGVVALLAGLKLIKDYGKPLEWNPFAK